MQPLVTIRPLYLARPDAAAFLALSESTLDALVARGVYTYLLLVLAGLLAGVAGAFL